MPGNADNIREELKNIYSDVSEWLKFAEAKHTALIALWTALIVAVMSIEAFWKIDILLRSFGLTLLLLGLVINAFAMMPFTNNIKWLKSWCYHKYKKYPDNRVFYRSIFVKVYLPKAKKGEDTDISEYIKMLEKDYPQLEIGELSKDYVWQIADVATVATIKTYLFGVSAKYLGVILSVALACIIIA